MRSCPCQATDWADRGWGIKKKGVKMKTRLIIVMFAVVFLLSGYVSAEEGNESGGVQAEQVKAVEFGNKICPISKAAIGTMGPGTKYEHDGKIYNFCCGGCIAAFKEDPEKYIKMLEEEKAAEKLSGKEEHGQHDGHGNHH